MNYGTMQDYPLTLDKFIDHAARWHPDAQVVSAHDDGSVARIGYRQLRDRSLAISAALAGMGIATGDCVATLAWNSQTHVESWYAVMGMGAVCHTLNPRLPAEQLRTMLRETGARILIASADLSPLAQEIVVEATALERVLFIDGSAAEWPSETIGAGQLEDLIGASGTNFVWGDFAETCPAALCFTSGTTGAPKGVTYTHRASFLHTMRALQADAMAFTARDSVLAVVPMFHANAWGLPFALPAVGGKLVLPGRCTDGESLARLIASENVTVGVGVPTIWIGLVEHLEATGATLPSLSRIIVGGAPLPPALAERIEQGLGVTIQRSWGMTELSPLGTIAAPDDGNAPPEASGRPTFGIDLLLTDAQGVPLPEQRDTEGHLRVKGAAVVARYHGHDDAATDADGWFPTGDLARIDGAGNLIISGRAKDLIKSGGEWINPAEIEALVGELPQVALAAVVGRQHEKWGERPILFVEMCPGETLDDTDLLAPLNGKVASWWLPDAITRLDNMPLASTGKIDKNRLRSEYAGG